METTIRILVCLGLGMLPAWAWAAEEEPEEIEEVTDIETVPPANGFDGANRPLVDRAVNQFTARPIRAGAIVFVVDHRTRQSFLTGKEALWRDYFGLDAGGLKIGLGLRFGILDDLDVGLYRLNGTAEVFDTYELDARYRILAQPDFPLDLAVRAGMSAFVHPGDIYAAGYFGQLMLDKVFGDALLVGLSVMVHSDSSNDVKSVDDTNWSLALGAQIEWRFLDWLAWDLEVGVNLAGYGSEWPAFATSLKILSHRHTFSIVFSNTQYMGADGQVANTWRGFDDLILGFQITREWNLW